MTTNGNGRPHVWQERAAIAAGVAIIVGGVNWVTRSDMKGENANSAAAQLRENVSALQAQVNLLAIDLKAVETGENYNKEDINRNAQNVIDLSNRTAQGFADVNTRISDILDKAAQISANVGALTHQLGEEPGGKKR